MASTGLPFGSIGRTYEYTEGAVSVQSEEEEKILEEKYNIHAYNEQGLLEEKQQQQQPQHAPSSTRTSGDLSQSSQQGSQKRYKIPDQAALIAKGNGQQHHQQRRPPAPNQLSSNRQTVMNEMKQLTASILDRKKQTLEYRNAILPHLRAIKDVSQKFLHPTVDNPEQIAVAFGGHLHRHYVEECKLTALGQTPDGFAAQGNQTIVEQRWKDHCLPLTGAYIARSILTTLDALQQMESNPVEVKDRILETSMFDIKTEDMSNEAKVYAALKYVFQEENYVLSGDRVMKPHVLPNGRRIPAWDEVGPLEKAIWTIVRLDYRKNLHSALTFKSLWKRIIELILAGNDYPRITFDRGVYCFLTGLYIAFLPKERKMLPNQVSEIDRAHEYYTWEEWDRLVIEHPELLELNAVKYFDMEFRYQKLKSHEFMKIDTLADLIPNAQKLSLEDQKHFYAALGSQIPERHRFHPRPETLTLGGQPMLGKSQIVNLVRHLFPRNAAYFVTTSKKDRVLQPLLDGHILWWCIPDLGECPINKSDFKSLTTPNEDVSVFRHYKMNWFGSLYQSFMVNWNEPPLEWLSKFTDMARRTLLIEFKHPLKHQSFDIADRVIKYEFDLWLQKISLAFLWELEELHRKGKESLWDILPKTFHDARNSLFLEGDSLRKWLKENMVACENAYIYFPTLMGELQKESKKWGEYAEKPDLRQENVRSILYGIGLKDDKILSCNEVWPLRFPPTTTEEKWTENKKVSSGEFIYGYYLNCDYKYYCNAWESKVAREQQQRAEEIELDLEEQRDRVLARLTDHNMQRKSVFCDMRNRQHLFDDDKKAQFEQQRQIVESKLSDDGNEVKQLADGNEVKQLSDVNEVKQLGVSMQIPRQAQPQPRQAQPQTRPSRQQTGVSGTLTAQAQSLVAGMIIRPDISASTSQQRITRPLVEGFAPKQTKGKPTKGKPTKVKPKKAKHTKDKHTKAKSTKKRKTNPSTSSTQRKKQTRKEDKEGSEDKEDEVSLGSQDTRKTMSSYEPDSDDEKFISDHDQRMSQVYAEAEHNLTPETQIQWTPESKDQNKTIYSPHVNDATFDMESIASATTLGTARQQQQRQILRRRNSQTSQGSIAQGMNERRLSESRLNEGKNQENFNFEASQGEETTDIRPSQILTESDSSQPRKSLETLQLRTAQPTRTSQSRISQPRISQPRISQPRTSQPRTSQPRTSQEGERKLQEGERKSQGRTSQTRVAHPTVNVVDGTVNVVDGTVNVADGTPANPLVIEEG